MKAQDFVKSIQLTLTLEQFIKLYDFLEREKDSKLGIPLYTVLANMKQIKKRLDFELPKN